MMADDELRHLFEAAGRAIPGEPLDWDRTITRARRSRRVRLAAVGAAAAIVLAGAVVGAVSLGRDDPRPLPPIGPTPTQTPAESPSPTPREEPQVSQEDALPSVDRFLAAAARGDAGGMWEEMSPPARRAFDDDLPAFEDFVRQGVSEGLGSWDAAAGRGVHFELLSSANGEGLGVATVFGERAPEGNVEPYGILPLPIRIDVQGDATIEWPLGVPPLEADWVVPEDRTPLDISALGARPTPSFEVVVDGTPSDAYMVVAPVPDEPAAHEAGRPLLEDAGAGRTRMVWMPHRRLLFSAEWFLTVVIVDAGGVLQSDATRFIVE